MLTIAPLLLALETSYESLLLESIAFLYLSSAFVAGARRRPLLVHKIYHGELTKHSVRIVLFMTETFDLHDLQVIANGRRK